MADIQVGAPPPPATYVEGQFGEIPADGLQTDFTNLPQPTAGEHIVQEFGPRLLDQETREIVQPFFEYSRCTGNRKALLVGINYTGTSNSLRGCINDVHNVHKFICDRFGYDSANIVILTDDATDVNFQPTKANIFKNMDWLVQGAKRGDALFFHYSGHGTQVGDKAIDEPDKQDEAICPVDFQKAGMLTDDESDHDHLVKPLPAGCRLTAIFDSCHSGSVMDIPYVYQPDRQVCKAVFDVGSTNLVHLNSGSSAQWAASVQNVANKINRTRSMEIMNEAGAAPGDVICWSGCQDDQTSSDTFENGQAVGAMSYAFITALTRDAEQSYIELLGSMREILNGTYTQIVQLSSCHPINTELAFVA